MIKTHLEHIKENTSQLKQEVRERTIGYILAALGLVAGLAWNDAIKALIDYLFPLSQNGLLAKFIYAAFITAFVVFVSIYFLQPKKDEANGAGK